MAGDHNTPPGQGQDEDSCAVLEDNVVKQEKGIKGTASDRTGNNAIVPSHK